eukprot:g4775.t1 g4775   contig16:324240-324800(+)
MGASNSLMPLTERLMSVLESVASSAPSTSWKMLKKESSIHQTNAAVLQEHQYQCLPTSMPPNINASQHFQKEQQQQLPMSNGSSFTQQPFQPIVTTPSTVLDRAIEGSPQKRLNDEARVDDALSCFIDPLSTNRGHKSNKEYVKKHRILVAKAIDEINSSVTSSEQFFHFSCWGRTNYNKTAILLL